MYRKPNGNENIFSWIFFLKCTANVWYFVSSELKTKEKTGNTGNIPEGDKVYNDIRQAHSIVERCSLWQPQGCWFESCYLLSKSDYVKKNLKTSINNWHWKCSGYIQYLPCLPKSLVNSYFKCLLLEIPASCFTFICNTWVRFISWVCYTPSECCLEYLVFSKCAWVTQRICP